MSFGYSCAPSIHLDVNFCCEFAIRSSTSNSSEEISGCFHVLSRQRLSKDATPVHVALHPSPLRSSHHATPVVLLNMSTTQLTALARLALRKNLGVSRNSNFERPKVEKCCFYTRLRLPHLLCLVLFSVRLCN